MSPRPYSPPVDGEGNPLIALRPREAAKALGIGRGKLSAITADRTSNIPHFYEGRSVLYPVEPLMRWAEERARAKT